MASLQSQITSYLSKTLGVAVSIAAARRLKVPFHISDAYQLLELSLQLSSDAAVPLLLIIPRDERYPGVVALKKHLEQVGRVSDSTLVFSSMALSARERRNLIDQGINFIQPGYQLFIPELAMDLREHVRKRKLATALQALLPATQAVLLGCLYRGWDDGELFTASALLGEHAYSRVTLGHVIEQLVQLHILQPGERQGAANTYRFTAPASGVFQTIRPHLRTPVRQRLAIEQQLPLSEDVFLAGETALSHYSLLAEPAQPTYGMTRKVFEALRETAFKTTDEVDDIKAWVEIWSYPSLTQCQPLADEASLLLSLEANPDERLQLALQTFKEKINWLSED